MTCLKRLSALATMLLSVGGLPAWGQGTVAQVMQQAGVLGVWATASCADAASPLNVFISYKDFGVAYVWFGMKSSNGPPFVGWISAARPETPTTVALALTYDDPNWGTSDGQSFNLVMDTTGGRLRLWYSYNTTTSTLLASDGKTVSNGQPTPSMQRCGN